MAAEGKSAGYWQKRFKIYEKKANLKSQTHINEMAAEYNAAKKAVEKDLAVFYNRLAANNDLPNIAAAKKLLTADELQDFHMTLEEYEKLAKENGITGDFTQQLENASLKHRISRLEAMKVQLDARASVLMAKEVKGLEQFTAKAYEDAYYNGGFEIAKGTGVGKSLFRLDDKKINTVIHKPWAADGKNFSERVWGQHRPQLINNLHRELTSSIMRGTGPDQAIKNLTHQFDVSMSSAARLVQTEEAYFTAVAQRDVFSDLEVEQYQIIATLDGHTSEICQDLDGKVFKMSEYEAGVTAPPFHVRCRSTTAPYFADEVSTRAARDPETGKTEQVPSNITYEEWKNGHIVDPETGKTAAQIEADAKAQKEAAEKAKAEAEAKAKAKAEEVANKNIVDELDAKEYYIDLPLAKAELFGKEEGGIYSFSIEDYAKHAKDFDAIENDYQKMVNVNFLYYQEPLDKIKELKADAVQYKKAMDALGGAYKSPTKIAKEVAEAEAKKAAEEAAKKAAEEAAAKAAKKAAAVEKAKATKAANAAKLKEAQAQIVQIQDNEFSGIWKDPVTPADYAIKKDAIAAKHAYFDQQIAAGNDVEKFKKLKADLDEFEFQGTKYAEAQATIEKLKPKPRKKKINLNDPNAYSQARKDAALWFDADHGGFREADKYFDPPAKEHFKGATPKEKNGFYTYTQGSGGHNRPLAGFRKPLGNGLDSGWEEKYKVGPKKVWIDFEGKGEQIRGLTSLIDKSEYDKDVWIQSGQEFRMIEGFLNIPYGSIKNMTDNQLQKFVGYKNKIFNFISGAVNEGGGAIFNEKPLKINLYAPKGTKMLYASDAGAYGKGENEMIFQRGGSYTITKVYWGIDKTDNNRRKIFVDMEIHPEDGYDLFQQDPKEWTGDITNYMDKE